MIKKCSLILIQGFFLFCSIYDLHAQCEDLMVNVTADPLPPYNLCPGETILLTATVSGGTGPYTYLWSDGTTNPTTIIIPPAYGNEYVQVTDATGCVAWGEIHIKAWVWTIDILYVPISFCPGDSMALHAYPDFPAGTTFLWSTGDTTSPIYITNAGTYSITATAPGGECSASVTEFVEMYFFPTPDPNITGPSVLCSGQSATLTAEENPDDTFLWSTGEVTSSIDISAPGIYSVTATNWQGCIGADTIEVLPGTAPPTLSGPTVLCNGQSGTVSVTNPGSYTSFLWSTGANTPSITINSAGTYSVTVTAPGGCTSSGSITVASGNSNMTINGTTTPVTSCINPNGSINLTVTPPGSYTFIWSNGASTEDINSLSAGNFTVTVTDAGGCTSSSSFTVTSNVVIPTTSTTVTSTTCDLNNGSVDLSVNPPGTYNFLWSNGVATEDLSNILAGTYTVTVTSSSGCTATASVSVPNNNPVINVTGNTTPFTSCISPNGAIDITASPSGTYTYSWSNGSTTEDLVNLFAGSYTVTVSAGGSCTSTATYDVLNNTTPPLPVATITADTCGLSNGNIDLTVTPTETYTFLWSNGATTEDLIGIPGGIYAVTITSSITGCTATLTDTVTNYTLLIVLNASPTAATCGQSNGEVDLNISPNGTYTFIWSNGITSEDLTNIPGGNYSVTVTSEDGCTNTTIVVVPDNSIPITITGVTSPNSSCTNENGSADITINPTGSYIYAWSNGASTEDIVNVLAGVYTVTVTLGLNCTNTQSFEVLENITPFSIAGITTPNSSCSQPNGTIDITVSTPGTYTYLWSNNETTEDLQQLTGGMYSVTVTGDNGCTATEVFEIINTNSNFSFSAAILPNTSCTLPNGQIDLTLSPTGAYSFTWTTGATTEDLQNLVAGNYGVTVTDINNCDVVGSFLIEDNFTYPVIFSQVTPATCGSNNGAIDLSIVPVNGNTFSWSNGDTVEDIVNLVAGDYVVTVTGTNGCISTDTFTVGNQNSNFTITGITQANNSCTSYNGSIDLTVSPPGVYTFLWSNGTTTEDLQNMAAGTYAVTVTDVSNCITSDTFLIGNNTALPSLSANILPANCGANNGSIDLIIIPSLNNTILWSTGSTTEDLPNVFPGSYSVIVTDSNGCQAIDTFIVQNINNNFSLSSVTFPITSCLMSNGSIDLTVVPAGSYNFLWSNGAITEDISGLGAGLFMVTVTDNAFCSSMEIFEVLSNTNPVMVSSLITPSGCGLNNGSIDVTPTPSTGNNFLWSNGATTEDLQNLMPGNYMLTVTGNNGCTTTDTFLVTDVGSNISLSGIPTHNTNCIMPNGGIDLSFSPTGTYSFIWSNGVTTEDQINIYPGTYSVTVTDSNGCSASTVFVITEQTILPVISGIVTPSICGGSNGQVSISILPSGNYSFSWSNGSVTKDLQSVLAGDYGVTVTSMDGCMGSSEFTVPNTNTNFSLSGIASGNTSCTNVNGSINVTVIPAGNYNFSWSNGAITEDMVNLPTGIYTLTVTDQFNCSTTGIYIIQDLVEALNVSPSITPGFCGEANGSINLMVTPSAGNIFIWSNGQTTEDLEDVLPGPYSVTVTAQNGCTWFSTLLLPFFENIVVDLKADLNSVQGDSTTVTTEVNIDIGAIDTILWYPEQLFSCAQPFCMQQTILTPVQSTEIMIMVIDTNGCMGEARLLLDVEPKPNVYIPNVFSPNHDGINDQFTIYGNEDVELVLELQIFDRWGNQVFVNSEFPPNEENYGWDGVFKNQLMNPAVFAYWARVRFIDGTEGRYKGDLTLVR